jgi:hypothetical protein
MIAPDTVPCSERAATACTVNRAFAFACVRAKTKGRPAPVTSETVLPMARRSCGLGRAGIITRSARGDRGRGVDDDQAVSNLFERGKLGLQVRDLAWGKGRGIRLTGVPPRRQRALRVGVDQDDGPDTSLPGGDRQMGRQRRLPSPALLAGQHDGLHPSSRG